MIWIIITLLLGIIIGWFELKSQNNRERDKDIVIRRAGGVDIATWWENFSNGNGNVLRNDEKKRLSTQHDLEQTQAGTKEQLPNDHVDWDKISLCYINRVDPFPFKHYFLQLTNRKTNPHQNWKLDFSLDSDTNKGEVTLSLKTQACQTESTQNITEDIIRRIVSVKNSTNFSYCLRNSEHFARYIYDGTWQSNQLTSNRYMRKIFDEIMSPEDRKKIATLPKDVQCTIPNNMTVMFPTLTGMLEFKKSTKLDGFKLPEEDFNILMVGPTGAGKSTIINLLFNQKVCKIQEKSERNFASVTREAQVVSGVHQCPDGKISINIIDTMGFCDIFLDTQEALKNFFSGIISEHSKIDRVVMVSSGKISESHQEAMKSLMNQLQYPGTDMNQSEDINRKRNNFVFIYHKTENMPDEEKLDKLQDMGDKLGVAIGHKIPVDMLKKGMEDSGVLETCSFKAGVATGINTSGQFDDATQKTAKKLKDILMPHTREVLKSPQRLTIAQTQCSIQ